MKREKRRRAASLVPHPSSLALALPQQQLFDTTPAAWEEDDAREQLVASVIFPTGPDKPFDYAVPDGLRDRIECGRRVRAPFGRGNRAVVGFCVQLENRSDVRRQLKPLTDVVDAQSLLSPSMLRLTRWMADRYLSTWGQALETVLPAVVRKQTTARRITLVSLAADVAGRIESLKKITPKQLEILRYLAEQPAPVATAHLKTALDLHRRADRHAASQGIDRCDHADRRP